MLKRAMELRPAFHAGKNTGIINAVENFLEKAWVKRNAFVRWTPHAQCMMQSLPPRAAATPMQQAHHQTSIKFPPFTISSFSLIVSLSF